MQQMQSPGDHGRHRFGGANRLQGAFVPLPHHSPRDVRRAGDDLGFGTIHPRAIHLWGKGGVQAAIDSAIRLLTTGSPLRSGLPIHSRDVLTCSLGRG